MKKIFYNSSLPRSGSTLLQNVLAQNPLFYATPTSGLYDLLIASKEAYTKGVEFSSQDNDIMERAFGGYCRGAIDGFCDGITEKEYVLDKNFSWPTEFNLLKKIYQGSPKIIIMVRDLREIFASMENGYRTNLFKISTNVNWEIIQNTTVKKRLESWAISYPIGSSLDMIREIINWKNEKEFFFMRYEDFCSKPFDVIKSLYKYLELDLFIHDFDNVIQNTYQNDHFYTYSHKIKQKIVSTPKKSLDILGESLCSAIYREYKWYFDFFRYNL